MRVTRIEGALLSVLALASSCSDDTTDKRASQPNAMSCDAKRPAVAYRASASGSSGEALGAPTQTLVPCAQLTGYASSETSLAVLKDGSVLVAPVITAEGTGVLRTKDRAGNWEVLLPGKLGGAQHQRVQPYMYVEPTTQRVLFATATGAGFALSLSDDGGSSWRASTVGAGTVDWVKIFSGPPAATGYPSTLYASSPAPISTAFAEYQQVQRSLDGGETWSVIDGKQLPLQPELNACPASEWVIYGGGVVAADGSVYLGFRRCTRLGIALTRDQGATWTVRDLPEATLVAYEGILSHAELPNLLLAEPLGIDSDGNLYAVWNDDKDVLRLAVSRDRAETWSKPVAVAPPGVGHTVFADVAVKAPGTIALAYYGSEDGGATYNAYASESLDALSATPTFHGARLNSPSEEPLFAEGFDVGYGMILSGGDLMEIVRVEYAPNGDIWTSFAKDMCPGMDQSHCTWDPAEHADAPYQLVMARLEHR
ncbi:MAG TPA: sialidase family protein [Polyangiales bacterium]|nr:sialidase family protein [Polyangiales bacterium]